MAGSDDVWERLEKEIAGRRWNHIKSTWPDFLTDSHTAGQTPAETLSGLLEGGGILAREPARGVVEVQRNPRGEIPEILLREGIFWLHKALHVLGASETHADLGIQTWSLSSAYQSSYFAARSLMCFFGVSIADFHGISVVVDICRDTRLLRPQRIERTSAFEDETAFITNGFRCDHKQTWGLFQRLLRVTNCDCLNADYKAYAENLDVSELTNQRHRLHYDLDYWVREDLHDFLFEESFYTVTEAGSGRFLLDSQSSNYSLAVGVILSKMSLSVFRDLCDSTKKLQNEFELILKAFSNDRHPLFAEMLKKQLQPLPAE